jgi:hypothetical protein
MVYLKCSEPERQAVKIHGSPVRSRHMQPNKEDEDIYQLVKYDGLCFLTYPWICMRPIMNGLQAQTLPQIDTYPGQAIYIHI